MRFLIVLLVLIDWLAGVPRYIPSLAKKFPGPKPAAVRFPESVERGMQAELFETEYPKPKLGE
jgi:hypothetical protein